MADLKRHVRQVLAAGTRIVKIAEPSLPRALDAVTHAKNTPQLADAAYTLSASYFFAAKALKSFKAMHLLWKSAFPEDAAMIGRTILEWYLRYMFICHDSNKIHERARRFHDYDYSNRENLAKRVESWEKRDEYSTTLDDARYEELKRNAAAVKSKYGKALDWTGMTLREVAKTLGPDAIKAYDMGYWQLSNLTHSNATAHNHYISFDRTCGIFVGRPEIDLGKTLGWPIATTMSMIGIIDAYSQLFNLNLETACHDAAESIRRIQQTQETEPPNH